MSRKVLIVDDEQDVRFMLEILLEQAGIEWVSTSRASSARSILSTKSGVHVIILDLMMPDESGLDLVRSIKSSERDGLRIIVLTARSDELTRQRTWALGVDEFITKPFDPVNLIDIIRKHCEEMEPLTLEAEE